MSQYGYGSQKSDPTTDKSTDLPAPADLSRFRLECLIAVAQGDDGQTPGDDIHGLGIKARLAEYYGKEIHHGQLYPNLDALVEEGLVAKREIDNRTNGYALTDAGRELLDARIDRLVGAVRRAAGDEVNGDA